MGISTLHLGLRRGEVLWFLKKIILQPDLTTHQLAPCKGIRIPESGNFLLLESGILGFGIRNPALGIRNPALGIRNPTKDWNPESNLLKIHSRLN